LRPKPSGLLHPHEGNFGSHPVKLMDTRKSLICLDFRRLLNATRSGVRLYPERIVRRQAFGGKTFLK
jgi:hypothetical protein